jgi:hypothetical protein
MPEESINPNQEFAFHYFDLTQAEGKTVYAKVMANFIFYLLCPEHGATGNHTISHDRCIIHFRTRVVPTLRKGDRWTVNEINQRDGMWITIGALTEMEDELWDWAKQFLRDTYEDTLIEVYKGAAEFINGKISPLN